jgi:hypothetical protein
LASAALALELAARNEGLFVRTSSMKLSMSAEVIATVFVPREWWRGSSAAPGRLGFIPKTTTDRIRKNGFIKIQMDKSKAEERHAPKSDTGWAWIA